MKRNIALAVLGMSVAGAISSFGQGAVIFGNYNYTPVSPISYMGNPVAASDGIQIEVWWAQGTGLTVGDLAFGANANLSAFAGYTELNQIFTIPGYSGGETWTLQLRASGDAGDGPVTGMGPLVETSAIADQSVIPPEIPTTYVLTPGFDIVVVPEPTTFALAGLGAAALLIFRRRE